MVFYDKTSSEKKYAKIIMKIEERYSALENFDLVITLIQESIDEIIMF